MVIIEDLKESDKGRSVLYRPKEGQYEEGTIVRWTALVVYVDFGYNVNPCKPSELRFL